MDKIKVEKKISQDKIAELGIESWPIWKKEVSEFPWSYDQQETCYIIEGSAEVLTDDGSEQVTFKKGDLVVFPKGIDCVWKITSPVKKHYKFE